MVARSIVLAVVLTGCSLFPAGGISRAEAIEIGARESGLVNPVYFNAYEGEYTGGPCCRPAWVVTHRGRYLSCEGPGVPGSPESEPCSMFNGESVVYIDVTTGELLGATIGGTP